MSSPECSVSDSIGKDVRIAFTFIVKHLEESHNKLKAENKTITAQNKLPSKSKQSLSDTRPARQEKSATYQKSLRTRPKSWYKHPILDQTRIMGTETHFTKQHHKTGQVLLNSQFFLEWNLVYHHDHSFFSFTNSFLGKIIHSFNQ